MPSRSDATANSNNACPCSGVGVGTTIGEGKSEIHQTPDSLLVGAGEQTLLGIQQVEHHEIDPHVGLRTPATETGALLQVGEGGLSVLVEGDHLAIDRDPIGERKLRQFRKWPGQIETPSRSCPDPPAVGCQHRPIPVPFHLEPPAGVVEGNFHPSRQHRFEVGDAQPAESSSRTRRLTSAPSRSLPCSFIS